MKSAPIATRPEPQKRRRNAMKPVTDSRPPTSARRRAALVLLLMLVLLGLLYGSLPLASAIKIGADEDFALSKALLSLKGYKMYVDFWNDQPPLHTFLLKSIFAHISFSVLAARLLTIASTLFLLSVFFVLVLRVNGLATAAVATFLMIGSPGFLELSSSAMVELPALAPVLAALCLLHIGPTTQRRSMEILAGLLFAVALQIKLIGALYLPLVALVLWLRHRESPRPFRAWMISGVCFSVPLLIGFFGIQLLTGEALAAQLAQSRSSHFSAARSLEYGSAADYPFDWSVLLKNWDTTLLTLIGLLVLLRRRDSTKWILPCAWLALTFVVFTNFKPWWNYYYVHMAIPLCWLASAGIVTMWQSARKARQPIAFGVLGLYSIGALAWLTGRVYLQAAEIRSKPRTYSSPELAEIKRYKPFTQFLWASEPVYAFHADMPIPPRIATLSRKRFWSGDMTNEKLAEQMQALCPGIILLTVDDKEPPFQNLLNTKYRLVYTDAEHQLYVLPAVIQQAEPWPGHG